MASHKNRDDEIYERGVRDGQNADFMDQVSHSLAKGWSLNPRETEIYNKGYDYGVAHRPQREKEEGEQKERRSSSGGGGGGGGSGSGGGGGGGGDNGCLVLIVVVILVAVIVWFIFAVVIPLLVINIAVIALILAGIRKQVGKFLLPLSVAGAALVVADYNQGWFTKVLAGNVAFFAGLIPIFLYLNIFAGLIAAYFLIRNFLNTRTPHEDGAGEFTKRNVITMVSLLLVGALTVGLQRVVDVQRATIREQMVAQAAEQARRAEANRIAERSRVEQALTGEWSNGSARLTISEEGNKFKAEYPSSMGLQVLSGELQTDNQLRMGNVKQLGKLVNPFEFYQGDFGQEAWIELGTDSSSLIVRFSQANGGRSLVMNRMTGNPDVQVPVADTPKTPPAENLPMPVVPPKPTPKTHEELIAEIKAKLEKGEPITGDEAICGTGS